tara:strand:+ start:1444 stop:1719 length:276 start_codon:yes stop_codon:yes gene_type:complete
MSKVVSQITSAFNEKLVQVSLVGGVLFYIVAHPQVFSTVEGLLKSLGGVVGVNVKLEGSNLLIFHSFVFAVLLGVTVKYIMTPFLKVVKRR